MAKIAFCGLGLMGAGMAASLLRAGHEVHVWNRSPAKADPLTALGAVLAKTPAAAAQDADAAFAMLADDEASRVVWLGAGGALAALPAGALAGECSTLSQGWVLDLAAAARARGLDYLDCPVTGLPDAAAAGELTLLVGGEKERLAAAAPLLKPLSKEILHFGPVGAGTAYKLIVNLLGAVEIAATAEAMETARRAGLDLALVAEALAKGAAGSFHVARQARIMAQGSHAENLAFTTNLRRKDSRYGVQLSKALGVAAPLGDLTLEQFDKTAALGFGEENESHVLDAVKAESK